MHVIRHDTPFDEFVIDPVPFDQSILNHLRMFRFGKQARAMTGVFVSGDSLLKFRVRFARNLRVRIVQEHQKFLTPFLDHFIRYRIRQPKRDGLHGIGEIPVGKIAA